MKMIVLLTLFFISLFFFDFSATAADTLKTSSGIKYVQIHKGDGVHPLTKQMVTIMYCIQSTTGNTIESSELSEPFKFKVDRANVIDGLHEVVKQMSKGESIYCIIPSELGHGEKGVKGDIAPNTTLAYYIQILEIE